MIERNPGLTRRAFLKGASALAASSLLSRRARAQSEPTALTPEAYLDSLKAAYIEAQKSEKAGTPIRILLPHPEIETKTPLATAHRQAALDLPESVRATLRKSHPELYEHIAATRALINYKKDRASTQKDEQHYHEIYKALPQYDPKEYDDDSIVGNNDENLGDDRPVISDTFKSYHQWLRQGLAEIDESISKTKGEPTRITEYRRFFSKYIFLRRLLENANEIKPAGIKRLGGVTPHETTILNLATDVSSDIDNYVNTKLKGPKHDEYRALYRGLSAALVKGLRQRQVELDRPNLLQAPPKLVDPFDGR